MQVLLLFSVFIIATCGLIYELVAGTLASYLMGDSVTQFSVIIGMYLFSMGIGSYLSKFFKNNLLVWFIQIEYMVGLFGGVSSAALFLLFNKVDHFLPILYSFVMITGILVGVEIPLIMRILKDKIQFNDLVSKVFTFDYIGALLASLIFPLVLVPNLGLVKTSLFFGMLNVAVGILLTYKLLGDGASSRWVRGTGFFSLFVLIAGFVFSNRISGSAEQEALGEKIILAQSSPYQRIVVTGANHHIKLYLNGNLQFNSADEYRYHEALVHPAMGMLQQKKRILVLGGGDGMAVREILKHGQQADITLVDLDPEMVRLFKNNPLLSQLNNHAFDAPNVRVVHDDAFQWLKKCQQRFDFICVDFPDPSNFAVGKLYTQSFYKQMQQCLDDSGIAVIQSTSPYVAKKSFWCIDRTIRSSGLNTLPYHVYVPSFGDWGYIMASRRKVLNGNETYLPGLKFIDSAVFRQSIVFPEDMVYRGNEVNKLDNQILVHLFEEEWAAYQ